MLGSLGLYSNLGLGLLLVGAAVSVGGAGVGLREELAAMVHVRRIRIDSVS